MKTRFLNLFFLIILSFIFVSNAYAASNCVKGGGDSATLCNPLKFDDPISVIKNIFTTFGSFFAITAVIMIVFSGFVMVTANGNEEKITQGKDSLKWSVLGLALALLSYAIVYGIISFAGVTLPDGTGTVPSDQPINPLGTDKNMLDLLMNMLSGFLNVAGIIAVLMVIIGGFKYMTAGGNEEQATQAKTTLQWAIIGVIVIVLAYVIVKATGALLAAPNL